jgi:hypothetical protein
MMRLNGKVAQTLLVTSILAGGAFLAVRPLLWIRVTHATLTVSGREVAGEVFKARNGDLYILISDGVIGGSYVVERHLRQVKSVNSPLFLRFESIALCKQQRPSGVNLATSVKSDFKPDLFVSSSRVEFNSMFDGRRIEVRL